MTNEAGAPWPASACAWPFPPRICDSSTPATDRTGQDHKLHKLLEARSDAGGDYRLEIPGIAARTMVSIDAMKPGYRRLVGMLMSGGDPRSVEVAPGKAAEASLILKPALYLAGIVVDEHGKPIPGVKIWRQCRPRHRSGGVERTASRPDGSFELFNYPAKPRVIQKRSDQGNRLFLPSRLYRSRD